MNLENYTERMRGFIQAAQAKALADGHQQFTAEQMLKVLLDDEQGMAASLIDRAGGDAKGALLATEAAIAKMPKISGSQGQLYMAPALAKVLEQADKVAKKAGVEVIIPDKSLFADKSKSVVEEFVKENPEMKKIVNQIKN